MRLPLSSSKIGICIALLSLPAWVRAEAYVDPATGSVVLQMLIAGFLGALFALKLFWHRLVRALSSLFGRTPDAGADGD